MGRGCSGCGFGRVGIGVGRVRKPCLVVCGWRLRRGREVVLLGFVPSRAIVACILNRCMVLVVLEGFRLRGLRRCGKRFDINFVAFCRSSRIVRSISRSDI